MQLFLRNIAFSADQSDCTLAFASFLHRPPFPLEPPVNFHVRLFTKGARRGQRHKGCGLLTLPNTEVAEICLRTYRGRLKIHGRDIDIQRSTNPPEETMIARIASTPWVDPKEIQEERERAQTLSGSIPLSSFAFGRLCRDGTFSSEHEQPGMVTVSCDTETRRLQISIIESPPTSTSLSNSPTNFLSDLFGRINFEPTKRANIWIRSSQIVALASSVSSDIDNRPRVFLETKLPPVLETENKLSPLISALGDNLRPPPPQRISSVNGFPMIPSPRFILLTFANDRDMHTFLFRARSVLHVYPLPDEVNILVANRNLYCHDAMEVVDSFLRDLDYPLAFEADKAIASAVLDPSELLAVQGRIRELQSNQGTDAAPILRRFISTLETPSLKTWTPLTHQIQVRKTRQRQRRRRRKGKKAKPIQIEPPRPEATLEDLLTQIVVDYFSDISAPRHRFSSRVTPAIYEAYTMILTPTSRILEGPLPDQSNSVLRRFGHHDCFLRVSFQDENHTALRRDPTSGTVISELLLERYKPILLHGLRLAGQHFEFLGYSMSGLKEHSIMFMRQFPAEDGTMMTADRIRNGLGDFSLISRKPALLGARWAQAFSASDPSVTLKPGELTEIPDRCSSTGSLFTDGCGTISVPLMGDVWKHLQLQRRRAANMLHVPSCIQIRFGGCKGVLFVDNKLRGRVACFRPSQIKYRNPQALTLDIASTSARPIRTFLNRPLILLLEHHGVGESVFLSRQKSATDAVERSRGSFMEASKLFSHHGFGTSFRLSSLFNNLVSQLRLDDSDITGLGCQILNKSVEYAATHVLREIKFRARIEIPGSWTLLGVSDEYDCLEEGEIFATVRDERTGLYKPIEGPVLITRSPQIHPGDVQMVKAVRRRELEHLHNVVVFSCRGERSLSSMLGGGDLDGDIFSLILDKDLFPKTTASPGAYIGLPHKVTPDPCTVNDIADFVINYIQTDLVGYISILHIRIADLKGPDCAECLQLAEYASHAVDFPKTGNPVKMDNLPRADRYKPDFLGGEIVEPSTESNFYPSKKVLGVLYRNVPLEIIEPFHEKSVFGEKITSALETFGRRQVRQLGLPDVLRSDGEEFDEDLLEEMERMMDDYSERLMEIAKTHTQFKRVNDYLTEAELICGTIQGKWNDHRKRREAVAAMELMTRELAGFIREELRRMDDPYEAELHEDAEGDLEDDVGIYDDEDDDDSLTERDMVTFRRAAAAWFVADEALAEDARAFGPSSFGLIALGMILDVVKKTRKLSRN